MILAGHSPLQVAVCPPHSTDTPDWCVVQTVLYTDRPLAAGYTHRDRQGRFKVITQTYSLFERKFQTEGVSPTNHCWCQRTRVSALSCGIKMSTVHCLVLSRAAGLIALTRQLTRLSINRVKIFNRALIVNFSASHFSL